MMRSYLRRDACAGNGGARAVDDNDDDDDAAQDDDDNDTGLPPVVERPQYMHMRIAAGIHHQADDLAACLATYDALSLGRLSHATPTMFNAGTPRPQMASCFLMTVPGDSIRGIFDAVTWSANVSKYAGGIGLDVSAVRAKGSRIRSSDGVSNGLVPMLQVFDRVARYVDQGGGKRKGAIAIYLEPWHPDIFDVLDMKKNHGKEELRARDLFYGLWIPDEFMRRVERDEDWSLICPDACPDLCRLSGDAFDEAYRKAEARRKLVRRVVRARDLWKAILDAQIETGTPYMLYKDACNAKSNHQHLGTLRCSNLCTEILEYVAPDEVAVCNLASIGLPECVVDDGAGAASAGAASAGAASAGAASAGATSAPTRRFDHARLDGTVRLAVRNLNRVIDGSFYPLEEARRSNVRHRPIGLGVQGLADVFQMLGMAFDDERARAINVDIFETIYFAALSESIALARATGAPYASYEGSPLSRGQLQCDLWGVAPRSDGDRGGDGRLDWSGLRAELAAHGARNSLLVAPMPTATTAQMLGNTECFEPVTSNIYTRRVLSGEFAVVNKHLVRHLEERGLWTPEVREQIVRDNGSVQNVAALSDDVKKLFRTVWEMRMRAIIDMAADRAPFIDQSQSLNLFVDGASHAKLTAMHMHAWKRGLKTGMYYLRTRAAADAIKVTVSPRECASCSA